MTRSAQQTARWVELSGDVLKSVETTRKPALEAIRKLFDEVTPALAESPRRKKVIDPPPDLLGKETG